MKRIAFIGALLISSAAFAQGITSTLHNFNTNTNAQASDGQICKYCHTPHKAISTRAIWNHVLNTTDAYTYDVPTTISGTPLRTTFNANQSSLQCLSCHDGTIALGDLYNAGGGAPGNVPFNGANTTATDTLQGPNLVSPDPATRSLSGNHPIGIPYAGQTYYTTVSLASIGAGNYWPQAAGVTQPVGYTNITLSSDGTGYGVECGTCHNPHGGTGFPYLLKADPVGSNICLSCHDK